MFRIIVSFVVPHNVIATGIHNKVILGYADREILGRSILVFCSTLSSEHLTAAISEASRFRTKSSNFVLCNKQGEPCLVHASTSPYVARGELVGCLIEFRNAPNFNEFSARASMTEDKGSMTRNNFFQSQSTTKTGIDGMSDSKTSDPIISRVHPRRKRGQIQIKQQAPVYVTQETINMLKLLPLPQAAASIGMSATALQRACRKLGVQRWPFRRRWVASSPSFITEAPLEPAGHASSSHNKNSQISCGLLANSAPAFSAS